MEKNKTRNSNYHKGLIEKKFKQNNNQLMAFYVTSNGHNIRVSNQQNQLPTRMQSHELFQHETHVQIHNPSVNQHQYHSYQQQSNMCNSCCFHNQHLILSTSVFVPYHSNQLSQSCSRKFYDYDSHSNSKSCPFWTINTVNTNTEFHEEKYSRNDKRSYPSKQRHFINSSYQLKKQNTEKNICKKKSKNNQTGTVDRLYKRFIDNSGIITSEQSPKCLRTGSSWDRVSVGIWNMFIDNQQNTETYEKKMCIWANMYKDMKTIYSRFGLFIVGSTMSGFCLNTSDIDMCLILRNQTLDSRLEEINNLERVRDFLSEIDYIESIQLITAKVPILRFCDTRYAVQVDLNCNNIIGIRNTYLLRSYSMLDWRVRPLVTIIKLWARNKNINDAKNMTISSYTLTLMVINFLQCGTEPAVLPCLQAVYPAKFTNEIDVHDIDLFEALDNFQSKNIQSLGELLLNFLHYYANFDYKNYTISVRLGRTILTEEYRQNVNPTISMITHTDTVSFLYVEEPFNLINTAHSVYNYEKFLEIKQNFLKSYEILNECRDIVSIFIQL